MPLSKICRRVAWLCIGVTIRSRREAATNGRSVSNFAHLLEPSTDRHAMHHRLLAGLILGLIAPALAWSATTTREQCFRQFSPKSGQAGKDVIWVPTLD